MTAPLPHVKEERAVPMETKPPTAPSDFTLRRLITFGSIVSAILLSANALVCATWSYFFGLPGWIAWQFLPGALAVAFIPATILRFRFIHPLLRIVYAITSAWVGALNFAFFAAVACWIVELIIVTTNSHAPRSSIATVLFGAALVATIYGLINAAWLRVTYVTVKLPNLPEAWQERTAALVTDLHLGPLSGPAFLRRVLARLRSLKPDVVFISGDLFDGPTLGLKQLVAPWRDFSAPQGVLYVTGNHDEFAERSLYLNAVESAGIRVLNNEKVSLNGLQVLGVHDSEASDPAELRSILRQAQIDPELPGILLSHRPINLLVAEEEGISLQLSGHTHQGQLWPWNLLVSRIYGPFAHGLNRLGRLQVYTCSGTGTWGPPLRLGTKAEIVLIQFEKEQP